MNSKHKGNKAINDGLEVMCTKKLPFFTLELDLECRPGETVVLTGPSGSGKSTALRCIAGLETICSGAIHFKGTCWNDQGKGHQLIPQLRKVGLLSQDYSLFPHMTIAQNVQFALSGQEEPVELLKAMGIDHLQKKRPAEISGGERQRAALCQTLANSPQLLLLDEPFSALDMENRYLLREILQLVQEKRHLPIIQVTHDLAEALTVATRIIPLCQGKRNQDWLTRQQKILFEDMERVGPGHLKAC